MRSAITCDHRCLWSGLAPCLLAATISRQQSRLYLEQRELARRVAEALLHLVRIRRARMDLGAIDETAGSRIEKRELVGPKGRFCETNWQRPRGVLGDRNSNARSRKGTYPMAVTFKPPRRPKEVAVDTQQSKPALEKPAAPDVEQREGDPEEKISIDLTLPKYDANIIFGPPPLARGEGPETHNAMLAAITAGVRPKDILEEFLNRDVVYLVLEVQRLRRIKANLPSAAMVHGLGKILSDIDPNLNAIKVAERWVEREPQAVAQVQKLLSKAGLSKESIADEAFMSRIDEIERVDRMIAHAEARRALALREIYRHRQALAEQFEMSLQEFTKGQIDYVPDPPSRRRGR